MTRTADERTDGSKLSEKGDVPVLSRSLAVAAATVAAFAVAVTATHLFVASPIDAVAFQLPPPQTFEGVLAPNDRLQKAELLLANQVYGPECIAVNRENGKVYTGLKTGLICEIEFTEGKAKISRAVRLTSLEGCDGSYHSMPKCGRPLGMRFHPESNDLFVVDAYLGLFSINWKTEKVRHYFAGGASISDNDTATPTRYLNDFDFLPDGRLVISESSTKFDDRDFIYDLLEHRPNGRLLAYNLKTDEISVLTSGLYFPNGVQVVRGKVLIAEMGKARILKFSPSSGEIQILSDNLPGYPDNIRQGIDKNLWVPLAATRSHSDNWLGASPVLRSLMTKLLSPQAVDALVDWVTPKYGLVLKVDIETGKVLDSLHDKTGRVSEVATAVEDGDGNLLLGSDVNYYLARLKL